MKRSNISLAIAFVALGSNALAQDAAGRFSSAELTKRTLERRAMDAVIWGMPIVSFDVMRQGFFRDAKACQIYEGSNQVQRIVIAREILR